MGRPSSWRGIRVRITALATLVVLAVLLVTAFALVTSQRRLLVDNLDESLLAENTELAATAGQGDQTDPLVVRGDDDAIAQIVGTRGEILAATANFAGRPALPPPAGEARRRFRSAELLDDEPEYRVLSRRAGALVIHTASPLDDVEDSLAALRVGLAVAIPIAALCLAAMIWWLVGRTLRPVEAIRREVADISGRDLHRRVPEPATDDEIAQLARTMNAMLDRVEAAADRQQRFVADASHELRSPLTRIRSELEVDLHHPDTADTVATRRSILDETEHLQRLVDDLLVLARTEARPNEPAGEAVDLDDVVLRETRLLRDTSSVPVDSRAVSAAQVRGDRGDLTRVVRNLAENAVRHARTSVTVTLSEHDGRAILSVADDGPGIPLEHREVVFERFTRLDEARAGTDGGTGLGLAIAREIVERSGGTIRIDAGHAAGARFVVELPAANLAT